MTTTQTEPKRRCLHSLPPYSRAQHCTACCQTFGGTKIGDTHRIGQFDPRDPRDARRCLTVEEMVEKGWTQDDRGVWHMAGLEGDRPSHWSGQV